MTETDTSTAQLTGEQFDAALSRLREWAQQIANAEADADRDSLDRAADLAAVYESKDQWVPQLPPLKKLAKRKARRDTQQEFARWTRLYPEKIGKAYTQGRVSQLLSAVQIQPLIYNQVINKGERALRPLTGKFAPHARSPGGHHHQPYGHPGGLTRRAGRGLPPCSRHPPAGSWRRLAAWP